MCGSCVVHVCFFTINIFPYIYHSVFVCGYGKYGRLGLRNEQNIYKPTEMVTMAGTPVVSVDCGELFTAMLTKHGDCYTCGVVGTLADEYKQNPSSFQVPCLVEYLSGQHVTHLAACATHLAAVVSPNEVYVWGSEVANIDDVGCGINDEPEHFRCECNNGGGEQKNKDTNNHQENQNQKYPIQSLIQ